MYNNKPGYVRCQNKDSGCVYRQVEVLLTILAFLATRSILRVQDVVFHRRGKGCSLTSNTLSRQVLLDLGQVYTATQRLSCHFLFSANSKNVTSMRWQVKKKKRKQWQVEGTKLSILCRLLVLKHQRVSCSMRRRYS